MEMTVYKEDLIKTKRYCCGEEVTWRDLRHQLRSIVYYASKVTFMDGSVPFIIKDRFGRQ